MAKRRRTITGMVSWGRRQIADGEQELLIAVACARKLGATWKDIAVVLDCTPQAAHERFAERVAAVLAADEEAGGTELDVTGVHW